MQIGFLSGVRETLPQRLLSETKNNPLNPNPEYDPYKQVPLHRKSGSFQPPGLCSSWFVCSGWCHGGGSAGRNGWIRFHGSRCVWFFLRSGEPQGCSCDVVVAFQCSLECPLVERRSLPRLNDRNHRPLMIKPRDASRLLCFWVSAQGRERPDQEAADLCFCSKRALSILWAPMTP